MQLTFYKKKLFCQVFLLSGISAFIIFIIVVFILSRNHYNMMIENMHIEGESFSKALLLTSGDAIINNDLSVLLSNAIQLQSEIPDITFVGITIRDKIIIIDKKRWQEYDKHIFNRKYYIHDTSLVEVNPFLKQYGVNYIYKQPILYGGKTWGWVHLGFSLKSLDEKMKQFYFSLIWLIILLPIIILILSFYFAKKISKPIERLSEISKRIIAGEDENIMFDCDRIDEIGELSRNFKTMVLELHHNARKLQESNKYLEIKVYERTQELLDINLSLDHRVKEEVRKRREQEHLMVQQSRFAAMGEMIGNVAHQWRQPLNALSLLIQNIKFAFEFGKLDAAYIDYVNEQGIRLTKNMSSTIDDFREFFRENKKSSKFNMSSQINNALMLMTGTFEHHNIQLDKQMDPDVIFYGMANEFSQVILNLLKNAQDILIEKVTDKRYIFIKVYQDEMHIYCRIGDNGGGIPPEIIERIFDPYFTTKEEGKGTGIGLYMSKVIIEKHMNGTLTVSNNENGAIFTISFPKKKIDHEVDLNNL